MASVRNHTRNSVRGSGVAVRAWRIGVAVGLFATLLMIPLNSGANPAARAVAFPDLQPASYSSNSSSPAPIRVVKMNDDDPMYQPNSIRIVAGQTIEWQNNGQVSHSVTDDPARANKP